MPLSPFYKTLYDDPNFERPMSLATLNNPELQEPNNVTIGNGAPTIPSPPDLSASPTPVASPTMSPATSVGASNPQDALTPQQPPKVPFLDYLQGYNQDETRNAIGNVNKLRVTPDEISRSRERQDLLGLQQGLSAATAKIGNIGGKVGDDSFAKYLESQVKGEQDALKSRQDAFTNAQQQVQQGAKGFADVGAEQYQTQLRPLDLQGREQNLEKSNIEVENLVEEQRNKRALRDVNSPETARARQLAAPFTKSLGIDVNQMSGEEIMSKLPVIEKAFNSAEERAARKQLADENRAARRSELLMKMEEHKAQKSGNNQKQETELRKEISNDPIIKEYHIVDQAAKKVQASANVPENSTERPAADVALLFAYMKLLDPTTGVKEGEVALARDTENIPNKVRNAYNSALTGQKLSPDIRKGMEQHSRTLFSTHQGKAKETQKFYTDIAGKYGLDPKYLFQTVADNPIKVPNKQGNVDVASLPVWTPGGK